MSSFLQPDGWTDISVPVAATLPTWPGDPALSIRRAHDMDKGAAANVSEISCSVHLGTHMDSPLHFIADGKTMSDWQLDYTSGIARVISIKDPVQIRRSELEHFDIQEGEIILVKTNNSSHEWYRKPFDRNFVHFSEDGAAYLAEKKIKCVGIDYLSVGGMDNGIPVHRHILGAGIWIVEGLYLNGFADGVYTFLSMPVHLEKADGSPARALLR
jgi:arylformamidase